MKAKEEKQNPKADAYISRVTQWREEFEKLRAIPGTRCAMIFKSFEAEHWK